MPFVFSYLFLLLFFRLNCCAVANRLCHSVVSNINAVGYFFPNLMRNFSLLIFVNYSLFQAGAVMVVYVGLKRLKHTATWVTDYKCRRINL